MCYHMDARHNLSFCVIRNCAVQWMLDQCMGFKHQKLLLFFRILVVHSTVYTCPVPRMGTTKGSRDKVRDWSHGVREGSRDGPTELAGMGPQS